MPVTCHRVSDWSLPIQLLPSREPCAGGCSVTSAKPRAWNKKGQLRGLQSPGRRVHGSFPGGHFLFLRKRLQQPCDQLQNSPSILYSTFRLQSNFRDGPLKRNFPYTREDGWPVASRSSLLEGCCPAPHSCHGGMWSRLGVVTGLS